MLPATPQNKHHQELLSWYRLVARLVFGKESFYLEIGKFLVLPEMKQRKLCEDMKM